MKNIFSTTLTLLVLLTLVFNCSKEDPSTQDPIKQRVTAAKIIPGPAVLQNKAAIYIDIPTTGGYLMFEFKDEKEKEALLNEVYLRYKSEFDSSIKEIDLTKVHGSARQNYIAIVCGEWAPINSADPNSWVYRYCCNLSNGVCNRETNQCAYC